MTKLFIIGNGFDRAHCLKTTYQDFREYLIKTYNIKDTDNQLTIPQSQPLYGGGIQYEDIELASLLITMLDDVNEPELDETDDGIKYYTYKWRELEKSLATLNYKDFFDWSSDFLDADGTIDYFKNARRNEDHSIELAFINEIKGFFEEWIYSIEIDKEKSIKDFGKLIGPEDVFLSFNYTKTLEKKYNISKDNICYIHWGIPRQKGQFGVRPDHPEVFFGHGNDELVSNRITGTEDGINKIKKSLRKKTEVALDWNYDFFYHLPNKEIKEIYSYGFSFSQVDEIYINEIIQLLDTSDITWYFNDFDYETEIKCWENRLKSIGYKGNFKRFSIEKDFQCPEDR